MFFFTHKGVFMYLQNATGIDEVISFGINPLVALLEQFENEHLDLNDDSESKDAICWNLIKDLALSTQQSIKRIHHQKSMKKTS